MAKFEQTSETFYKVYLENGIKYSKNLRLEPGFLKKKKTGLYLCLSLYTSNNQRVRSNLVPGRFSLVLEVGREKALASAGQPVILIG